MGPDTYTIHDVAQLRLMAHPYRMRIIHDLAKDKFTVTQLAEKYGDTPAKVHHHVKKLEKAGLVKLVETREVSGILEKYYRAVAGDFRVARSLLETAEAQDSVADSTQRMLKLVYARAKKGFASAIRATDAAGAPEGAKDDHAGPKQAGTLGMSYVRLKHSEVAELSSKVWGIVKTYEDRARAGPEETQGADEGQGARDVSANLGAAPNRSEGGERETRSYAVVVMIFPDEPSEHDEGTDA